MVIDRDYVWEWAVLCCKFNWSIRQAHTSLVCVGSVRERLSKDSYFIGYWSEREREKERGGGRGRGGGGGEREREGKREGGEGGRVETYIFNKKT